MTDGLDAAKERHPSDKKRVRLLGELAQINAALARHDALPDMTVGEAANLSLRDLRVVVEASGHRLADLIKATTW